MKLTGSSKMMGLIALALRMYDSKEYPVKEIIDGTGISQGSLYRAIQKRTLETT